MRFKSVFGSFFFILFASFVATIIFFQSKSFGVLLTKIVTDVAQKKAQTKVSIRNVDISFFPPGIELNRVSFLKEFSPEERLYSQIGKFGFYVSLIEVEDRRLTFGEIRVSDSVIHYNFPKKDEELKEIDQKLIDQIFDLAENSPVRVDTLIFENSKIHANHDLLEIRRLKVFRKDKYFMGRFHLSNLRPVDSSDIEIDELWGDIRVSRKNIDIYRLKVLHDVQTLLLKGKISEYPKLKNARAQVNGEASLHLKNFDRRLGISDVLTLENGFIDLDFKLSYEDSKPKGEIGFAIRDLRSNYAHAETVTGKISASSDDVTLHNLELKNKKESAVLKAPVSVYSFKNKKLLPDPLHVRVSQLELTNALRFLPSLKVLHGRLNGDAKIQYDRGNIFIFPIDGFYLERLALVVGKENDPFTIIDIKKATLKETELSVVKGEFTMGSHVTLPHSKFEVDGYVSGKEARFSVVDGQVNLEDLGNIAQIGIKGQGPLNVSVSGPLENVVIDLRGKMKGFEVLGYKLGDSEEEISIDLGDDEVVIKKLESRFGSTLISGNGVVNYGNADIALGINSPGTNYQDLSQILAPVFKDLDFLPEDLNFTARVDADIYGKYRLPDLKIKSSIQFSDLSAYGENINSGSFNIGFLNQVFSIQELDATKERGDIGGMFSFAIPTKKMKADLRWNNLALSSFNLSKKLHLNINGKVTGTLKGEGTKNDLALKLESKIFDTKSPTAKFDDSDVSLLIQPSRISGSADLLGNLIKSRFDVSTNFKGPSKIAVDVAVPDSKPLLVALLGPSLENEEFRGNFFFNLNTHYTGSFEKMNLIAQVKSLAFHHEDFNLDYTSNRPDFVIQDDQIKRWDLSIKEPDVFVVTQGRGTFGKSVSLINEFHFNSKLLEILIGPILSAEGVLRNVVRIDGKGSNYDMSVSSKGDKLGFSIEGLPVPILDLNYALEYSGKRLHIQELRTALDTGSVSMVGDVYFDDNKPDVNVKYTLDRAEIPILGKSSINLSGEGIILGNAEPYNVSGEIMINRASIVNELNEFDTKSNALASVRFLPRNQESVLGKYFILNLNVKAENPIRVSNSLMDLSLKGEMRLLGNPSRPRGEGRLYAPVNSSRVFFKNSEYYITNADLNFTPKKDIANPDFDVQAVTTISTYKVYAKAYGDLERFSFDLTSDPALTRNSILSLVAFGYTDEMQNSLEQKNQQNLTQVGVGSFVFDRFKISDILKKQFGLQVNLGTVFEQSQFDSLLSGRSQEGQGNAGGVLGRTRSATKIELKKRLDEALSLSVSSTMGGNIGQRQSMNLTYGVNKKVQLEGVYELRTNDEGQEDIIDNSIGGDLKFRWTFR